MTMRGQSEVIGLIFLTGIVVIGVTLMGGFYLDNLNRSIENQEPTVDITAELTVSNVIITHRRGEGLRFSELVLKLQRDGTEREYNFSDTGDLNAIEGDGDDRFEPGESVIVDHNFTGDVRILLVETTEPGYVLFDETLTIEKIGPKTAPTIEEFVIADNSDNQDASFDVTWNASDLQGDITEVTTQLINDGVVEDSKTTSFSNVTTTGVNTDTLINAGGEGKVYEIKLTVTDSAGNTVTASKGDTADSDIGIRPPTIEQFQVSDVSSGNEVKYDYTYNASDPDGDLVKVTLELFKESTGVRVDNVTDSYTEVSATGIQTGVLTDPTGSKNDGEKYRIDIVVTDLDGNDILASVTDTADGDGTGGGTGAPPSVNISDVNDTTSPSPNGQGNPASFNVTWEASDVDGNLQNATLELLWTKGQGNKNKLVDSVTYSSDDFSSGGDTGTQTGTLSDTKGEGDEYVIRLVVTDDEGKTGSQEETHKADGDDTIEGTDTNP